MRLAVKRMRSSVKQLFKTGFFSVFCSNVLCKILTFIGGMIIVRVMSKEDYGTYSYILNCFGMLTLLNDLGCNAAVTQFCSENYNNPEKFNGYYTYGVKKGMLFTAITFGLILFSDWFYPFQDETAVSLTRCLCLVPFISVANAFLLSNLRVRLENNKYAVVNVFTTVIHYLVILPMAYCMGIRGAIFSNYIINLSVFVFSMMLSRKLICFDWKANVLNKSEKKSFLRQAIGSQLNDGISHALVLLDIFLIGIFVGENTVISSYKVGSAIPSALAFIPQSIMIYVVPYFARNIKNTDWVRKNYMRLIGVCVVLNFIIVAGGILIGPWMIPWMFGSQYADSVTCYTILLIGYFFSGALRIPTANVLYTQHKVRVNIMIIIVTGIANCVLDVFLILKYGSIGAAVATMLVQILGAVLNCGYMYFYMRGKR